MLAVFWYRVVFLYSDGNSTGTGIEICTCGLRSVEMKWHLKM